MDLPFPPDRVWRALTDVRLRDEWFLRSEAPVPGGLLTFLPDGMLAFLGPVSAQVTELVAPTRLAMRWRGEQLDTSVVWELAETAGGCRVRVVQSGFIGAPVTPRRRKLRAAYAQRFGEDLPALLARMGDHDPPRPAPPVTAPPALTAEVTTARRLLGLGGRCVTVTVHNPGPADAATWQVTMDVGNQRVTGVAGAAYTRHGSTVTFTPASGGLAAGASVRFRFQIPGGLLGLGSASDPTGCMIDGQPVRPPAGKRDDPAGPGALE